MPEFYIEFPWYALFIEHRRRKIAQELYDRFDLLQINPQFTVENIDKLLMFPVFIPNDYNISITSGDRDTSLRILEIFSSARQRICYMLSDINFDKVQEIIKKFISPQRIKKHMRKYHNPQRKSRKNCRSCQELIRKIARIVSVFAGKMFLSNLLGMLDLIPPSEDYT